jgi:hypothetical protein
MVGGDLKCILDPLTCMGFSEMCKREERICLWLEDYLPLVANLQLHERVKTVKRFCEIVKILSAFAGGQKESSHRLKSVVLVDKRS